MPSSWYFLDRVDLGEVCLEVVRRDFVGIKSIGSEPENDRAIETSLDGDLLACVRDECEGTI